MLQVPADMVCRVWLLKDQVLLEAELFQLLSAFLILQVPGAGTAELLAVAAYPAYLVSWLTLQVLPEAIYLRVPAWCLMLQVPLEAELFPCLVWLLIVLIQEVALQFLRLTLLTQGGGICL